MKRLVFSLVVAALAMCPVSHAAEYARSNQRAYGTSMPNARFTSTEKSLSVLDEPPGAPPADVHAPPAASVDGYPFVDRCPPDCSSCCDNVWDGYTRRCGLAGLHSRLFAGGCGTCDPCDAPGKRVSGLTHGGCGCAGGFGGCFGNSFAGGNACGGCDGALGGLAGLGCRLHHFGSNCCSNLTNSCRRLGILHSPGMFFGCDDSCGCASHATDAVPSNGKPAMQVPPAPPADAAPDAEQVPPSLPVPEKSAYRPTLPQTKGGLLRTW